MDKKLKMSLISHTFGNNTCHKTKYRFAHNILKTAFFVISTDPDHGQMHFFCIFGSIFGSICGTKKLRANVCAYEITEF